MIDPHLLMDFNDGTEFPFKVNVAHTDQTSNRSGRNLSVPTLAIDHQLFSWHDLLISIRICRLA
jgi:hypothetical protein